MNDPFAVGSSERVCQLHSPFQHLFKRQGLAGDAMLERGTFHEFHCDKRLTVLVADFVDGANVGMIQGGGCAGFSLKTFQRLWNPGEVIRKKFKSDKPAE